MSALKQSAPDWCFFKASGLEPDAYYRRLRDLGCRGVEMLDPARWAAARSAGLEILNLIGPGMREGLNRPENHPALLPQIEECIRTAADNGIPHVIVFSGNRAGQPDDLGLGHCATAMRRLAPTAERAGVTLVFEMLCRQNHPDYQADHSAYGFALVEAVGSPAVKVLYDIYHMHRMGEEVVRDVTEHLDAVAHLHVAGSPDRGFPGPGQEIDYRRVVREIHAAGYRGYWGQEWRPGADALEDLRRAVALFDSYL